MFIDARSVPEGTQISTDVCIIGAGAAGITLALECIDQSFEVCLLESGGLEYEEEIQALNKGTNVGHPYFPLETTRLRYFGGSTNHWGGTCRPMDKIAFEEREWVPHSGWPFSRDHLLPYYERAQPICELGPFIYEPTDWKLQEGDRPLPFTDQDRITTDMFQYGPPTRFGSVYRDRIDRAPNIKTYLHANVLDIEAAENAASVDRVRVSSLERNPFWIRARLFVVACGAIENARLLLLSNGVSSAGLGNDHDLVGRFFSDHVGNDADHYTTAVVSSEFPWRAYRAHAAAVVRTEGAEPAISPTDITRFLAPSEETLRREQLLSCGAYIWWPSNTSLSPGVKSLRHITGSLKDADMPDDFWHHVGNIVSELDDVAAAGYRKLTNKILLQMHFWSEQCPNPDSRVQLTDERDTFGKQMISLDWRLTEMDRTNIIRFFSIISEELGRKGLGRVRIDPVMQTDQWHTVVSANYHQMGTTRMHQDPSKGVVDADSRVHGISNLYVAGSSIFPATGHSNPTLTIVAMTLRLADHIKALMR